MNLWDKLAQKYKETAGNMQLMQDDANAKLEKSAGEWGINPTQLDMIRGMGMTGLGIKKPTAVGGMVPQLNKVVDLFKNMHAKYPSKMELWDKAKANPKDVWGLLQRPSSHNPVTDVNRAAINELKRVRGTSQRAKKVVEWDALNMAKDLYSKRIADGRPGKNILNQLQRYDQYTEFPANTPFVKTLPADKLRVLEDKLSDIREMNMSDPDYAMELSQKLSDALEDKIAPGSKYLQLSGKNVLDLEDKTIVPADWVPSKWPWGSK